MSSRRRDVKALALVVATLVIFLLLEAIGAWLSGSLALLADVGHLFSDLTAHLFALAAIWIARQPPDPKKTYGYYRAEILGALFNGLFLFAVVGGIVVEALRRMAEPPPINGSVVLLFGALGLLANGLAAWLLHRRQAESLNVRAAFLHVLADALGSIGVLVSGLVIWLTGWHAADPAASLFIASLIAYSSLRLIGECIHVLLEGAPAHIDTRRLEQELAQLNGVREVHDLHVWTLTSGVVSLSVHAVVENPHNGHQVLSKMQHLLKERYQIDHTTIQLESQSLRDREPHI